MKLSACSISKNEENKVESWFENIKCCDDYYVLDTGSSDDTVNKLISLGIKVGQKIIDPFDFSKARNLSLDLIQNPDWVVSIDFDEKLEENWREKVEGIIKNNPKITAITVDEGEPDIDKKIKIYKHDSYTWHSPVHEHLLPKKEDCLVFESDIKLKHRPDIFDADKEQFYFNIAKNALDKGEFSDWLLWFCLNYSIKIKNIENIIEYAQKYLLSTQKPTTDFRILCMNLLSEYLPYDQGVIYLLRSFIEYPCDESFIYLIKYGFSKNKPELILFLSSIYKSDISDSVYKEALNKLYNN